MLDHYKQSRAYRHVFYRMDRPIVTSAIKNEQGKVTHLILSVSDSEKYPGKSFELILTPLEYYLFLWQRLRKWRVLKILAGIIALIALYYQSGLVFIIGGSVSVLVDLIYFTKKGAFVQSWYIYLVAYILGALILGFEKGIFFGSIILNVPIIFFDPSFELNPALGLNIDKIKYTSKKVKNNL